MKDSRAHWIALDVVLLIQKPQQQNPTTKHEKNAMLIASNKMQCYSNITQQDWVTEQPHYMF